MAMTLHGLERHCHLQLKRKVRDEDDNNTLTRLTSLEKQGQMLATSADEEAEVWGKTIQTLPSEQM